MKKTRVQSLFDSLGNTMSGFFLGLLCQALFLPAIGVEISGTQNLIFAAIMTGVSWMRGFAWSRFMEWLQVRVPLSPAMLAIVAERRRQMEGEGYSAEHDDEHSPGDLAHAAACYALADRALAIEHPRHGLVQFQARDLWIWGGEYWKPVERRRNWIKAGALMVAELDKLERGRKALARRHFAFPRHRAVIEALPHAPAGDA